MALTKITSTLIKDNAVITSKINADAVDETKIAADAVNSEQLVDGGVDDAHLATGIDATKLTGSIDAARIPEAAVTQHVQATDLTAVHQSIATLGLHMGVADNKAAFNLPNAFIDTFEDDTGITTETTVDRDASGEYVHTLAVVTDTAVKALWTFPTSSTTAGDATGNVYTDLVGKTDIKEASNSGQLIVADGPFSGYSSIATPGNWAGGPNYGWKLDTTSGQSDNLSGWPGTGAFTIELWFRKMSVYNSGHVYIMDFSQATGNERITFAQGGTTGNSDWFGSYQTYPATTAISITDYTNWYHIAYVRDASGNHATMFNGNRLPGYVSGSSADLDFVGSDLMRLLMRHEEGDSSGYHGRISNIRLSNSARYDPTASTYTIPTAAFTLTTTGINATGTFISDPQTAPAATTEVSGVILYKDNAGTNTLGTDLKIYFTANNGTNWTEASSYGTAQTFSGTTKQVKLGKTTVTSGTQVAMKAVWANQVAAVAGASGAYDTGDRTSTITVTNNGSGWTTNWEPDDSYVNGTKTTSGSTGWYTTGTPNASGLWIRFEFATAQTLVEARMYKDNATVQYYGVWKWQGSNVAGGASGYVDIGSSFTLGGDDDVTNTAMSGNTTAYKYYQLTGVSGTVSGYQTNTEIEFKTADVADVPGKEAQLHGWAVNY